MRKKHNSIKYIYIIVIFCYWFVEYITFFQSQKSVQVSKHVCKHHEKWVGNISITLFVCFYFSSLKKNKNSQKSQSQILTEILFHDFIIHTWNSLNMKQQILFFFLWHFSVGIIISMSGKLDVCQENETLLGFKTLPNYCSKFDLLISLMSWGSSRLFVISWCFL